MKVENYNPYHIALPVGLDGKKKAFYKQVLIAPAEKSTLDLYGALLPVETVIDDKVWADVKNHPVIQSRLDNRTLREVKG